MASEHLDSCRNEITRILEGEGKSATDVAQALFDAERYAYTIDYMKKHDLAQGKVLEIGSADYLSSRVIWSAFECQDTWQRFNTTCDLRYAPLPFDDASMDGVLCLEVIEHLSDLQYQHATTLSGLFAFLDELFRVVRPGGKVLISTPNAASIWTIQRALLKQVPMMYDWHFREFTVDELRRIMEFVGFDVIEIATEYVWHKWDFSPIVEFIKAQGYSLDDRGDDTFVVLRRPSERIRRPHGLNIPG
jgi:SAM-dependent methyltransferase